MKTDNIYITDTHIHLSAGPRRRNAAGARCAAPLTIERQPGTEPGQELKIFLAEQKIRLTHVTLGIPRPCLSVKYLNFPSSDSREIRQMVEYEIADIYPAKPEELIYDYAVIGKDSRGYSQIMLVAALKDTVSRGIDTLTQAGVVPETVTATTVILFNKISSLYPQGNYLILHFDESYLEILLINNQNPVFSRGVIYRGSSASASAEIDYTASVLSDKGYLIEKVIVCGNPPGDIEKTAREYAGILAYPVEADTRIGLSAGAPDSAQEAPLRINLLPEELKSRKAAEQKKKGALFCAALIILNAALIANIVFFRKQAKENYLSLLKETVAAMSIPARELQARMMNIRVIRGYLNSGRLTLGVLSEIYRVSPEGIILQSLDIAHQKGSGTIVLTGRAPDSNVVLRYANALKSSQFITKTDVTSIRKRELLPQKQSVDFEIRAAF